MGMVDLKNIKPGMILGDGLKDRNGRTLLKAGMEITESHLKTLKMWGITGADIEGVEKEEPALSAHIPVDPQVLQEAEIQLGDLFRHTNRQHPFITELFRLILLQKVAEKSGGKPNAS